jgi:hypothetical protein
LITTWAGEAKLFHCDENAFDTQSKSDTWCGWTTELLNELSVPIPNLSPYDPANDEPFPWEAEVRAAIEKIRAEKAAKQREEQQEVL